MKIIPFSAEMKGNYVYVQMYAYKVKQMTRYGNKYHIQSREKIEILIDKIICVLHFAFVW